MIHAIDAPLCTLGENPLWRADTEEFYWTDIVNGIIYAIPASGTKPAYPVLETPYQTGAFLFTDSWDLLLFTEQGVFLSVRSGDKYDTVLQKLWEVPADIPFVKGERFNDAICGPDGRIMAGSKRENNESGILYCFEPGRNPRILLKDLQISNGMGFSPDGTIFYHTDSGPGTITAYRYSPAAQAGTVDGTVDGPVDALEKIGIVYRASGPQAVPDGMTVDAQGNIWTAVWGGGCVLKLSPSGRVLCRYPLDAVQVSSVCFGGEKMDRLFVTSASIGGEDNPGTFLGGPSYLLDGTGCGKTEYAVTVRSKSSVPPFCFPGKEAE